MGKYKSGKNKSRTNLIKLTNFCLFAKRDKGKFSLDKSNYRESNSKQKN